MDATPLVLVLASALMHATWNAILKGRQDGAAGAVLIGAGSVLVSGAAAALYERPVFGAAGVGWILASSLVEALYFVTLTRALSRLPLGTAYGLSRGGGQLITWPVSLATLGEPFEGRALLGAGVLTCGLFAKVHRPGDRRGLAWALACACAIGLYPLTYKAALGAGVPPFTLFALSMAGALPVQLALMGRTWAGRLLGEARRGAGWLALSSALCAGSFLAFLFALELGGAGRLTSLRNTSIVFAAVYGWAGGEALDRRSVFAVSAIVVGAILLAW